VLNKDNGRITPHLRELLSFFPYDFARPAQREALEAIARVFRENIHFSMIEAPTGTGKSALAIAVARYAATLGDGDYEPGAYILTPYTTWLSR
jgi:Rad3-related DNA helicase